MTFRSLDDIEFDVKGDEILGEGAFSSVKLVKLRQNGKLYALKMVTNYPNLDRSQADQ
jgi:serine/threonine protein kinase